MPQACIRCPVNRCALAASGESQHNSDLACVAAAQKVSSSRSRCFVFSLSIFLSPLQQSLSVLGSASRHLLSSSSSSLSLFSQLPPAVELSAATDHRIIWTFTPRERPALICLRSSIPAGSLLFFHAYRGILPRSLQSRFVPTFIPLLPRSVPRS
ncbi:hypothetical protein VTN02DRAFT_3113 [Thermoascus thermophilus]